MADAKVMVHIRLSKDVLKAVDHLAVEWDTYRGEAIERLLRAALPQSGG